MIHQLDGASPLRFSFETQTLHRYMPEYGG